MAALILSGALLTGCTKEDEVFEEPYQQGNPPLGIKIDATQVPQPEAGLPGTTVTINATGLMEYKDQLIFRFNGQQAQISEITASGIKVVVPDFASSGVTSLSVGDRVVFGPIFKVTGMLEIDPTFRAINGTNGPIYQQLLTGDGKAFYVGGFTNYDNKGIIRPINRIARTFQDGTYDASLRAGRGANGQLSRILKFGDKYIVAGYFGGYDQQTQNISDITMLNSNGSVDTVGVKTFRRPTQTDTTKYFPRFNGGVRGGIDQLYEHEGKIIAVGGFNYYVSRQYDKANRLETRDTVIIDSTEVRQIARFNADASLDKTYRFNLAANRSLDGGNGSVRSIMHKESNLNGKMVVYGGFTRFDGQPKGYITRLNPDGTIDPTFNPGGVGADFRINKVSYSEITKKYVIVGTFRKYNGVPIEGIALLNEDGTLDQSFVPKKIGDGNLEDAKQLSDGKLVVTGRFKTYDGIIRSGFMVIDNKGALVPGYNSTGVFNGFLSDVIETQTEDGKPALLLIGGFDRFNNEPVNNIIRLVINK